MRAKRRGGAVFMTLALTGCLRQATRACRLRPSSPLYSLLMVLCANVSSLLCWTRLPNVGPASRRGPLLGRQGGSRAQRRDMKKYQAAASQSVLSGRMSGLPKGREGALLWCNRHHHRTGQYRLEGFALARPASRCPGRAALIPATRPSPKRNERRPRRITGGPAMEQTPLRRAVRYGRCGDFRFPLTLLTKTLSISDRTHAIQPHLRFTPARALRRGQVVFPENAHTTAITGLARTPVTE